VQKAYEALSIKNTTTAQSSRGMDDADEKSEEAPAHKTGNEPDWVTTMTTLIKLGGFVVLVLRLFLELLKWWLG
jgi:hypothetical protein